MTIEFVPREGEEVEKRAEISRAAIVAIWVSIPLAILIFLFPVLSGLIKGSIWGFKLFGDGFGSALGVLAINAAILLTPVIFAYIGFAIVYSNQNKEFALIVTNYRVIGKNAKQELSIDYQDLVNVHEGHSVLGSMFGYGDLTLQSGRESITVKNIKDAEEIRKKLLEKIGAF